MMELFEEKSLVKICAPMVRYSRLPFRLLVKEFNCDLTYSPMIISNSFVKSEKCRLAEFSTSSEDEPLIVQFAANTPEDFAEATEIVYNDCNGVDLNCGCPQSWAIKDNIGACLLQKPEIVADILRQTRARIPSQDFSVSCKVRIFKNLSKTIDMVRQLESAGISFLAVHGRTIKERKEPVDLDTIRAIVDAVNIPVIANGDINSLEKAIEVQEYTGVKGVMSAREILRNPGMYAGHPFSQPSVFQRWLEINEELQTHSTLFHRHLVHMTETVFNKQERNAFNELKDRDQIIQFIKDKFEIA